MKETTEETSTPSSAAPKPKKKKKEATKSREWERDRRERLNNSFTDLSKLLPTNSNVAPTRKMEILQKASAYIKTLQLENAELLESSGTGKTWSREVKQLQCQVKELTSRNQQLVLLLQDAGGKLPPWVSVPALGKRQLHYSHKFTQEDLERSLAEPKKKKSRKTSQKEKGTDVTNTKKKKTNSKASKKSASSKNLALSKIKPPSVAQLLNEPSTTSNSSNSKIEGTPSTSSLVILPPEKPPPLSLSNGIIVVKGSNQSTATTNTLSSGLLFMRTPPNCSQPSSLAAKPCILLSNTNSSSTTTVQQTSPVVPQSSQQLTPAQTTTLLTAPIMATGQSSSILHTSQSLPSNSSSNKVAPTFVLANGNLVPVLPTSSKPQKPSNISQQSINLAPKPQKVINKNANKVPIPKLPKRNLRGNKTIIKKKKVICKEITNVVTNLTPNSISNVTLDSLKSIVTSVGSTNSIAKAVKNTESNCVNNNAYAVQTFPVAEVLRVTESNSVLESEPLESEKGGNELDISETVTEKCAEISEVSKPQQSLSPQTVLNVSQTVAVSETSGKPMGHKSSYSIDSLCKGKQGTSPNLVLETVQPTDIENSELNIPVKNKVDKESKNEHKINKLHTNKISFDNQTPHKIINEQKKEKSVKNIDSLALKGQNKPETILQETKPESNIAEIHNEKCIEVSVKCKRLQITSPCEKIAEPCAPMRAVRESILTFPEANEMCVSGSKTFYSNYDNCSALRNHEFVPAEISPSGFIGPQPPMATVVDAPLSKEGIEQYPGPQIYRPNVEDSCRTEEHIEHLENQQTEVLSNSMPSTFSSDIFASLNVPSGHPESISPTAAFLLAFPLVSSSTGRTNEMMSEQPETQRSEACNSSGNSLLQLGSMDEQPSSQAVVELNSLMTQGSRQHHSMLDTQNNSHIMQNNNHNLVQNTQYKNQSKVPPNHISCVGSTIKNIDSSTKQFNSHAILPPMPHNSYQVSEQISDYDAEISSIMSNTNHGHHSLPPQSSQNKNLTERNNAPANSCRSKTNERGRESQYPSLQQQNNAPPDKQFPTLPMHHSNNVCHQQQICGEQMQQPLYRPCNTTKKQMQLPQQIPYHNTAAHFSSVQQTDRNSRCNTANYNQPIFGSSASNTSTQSQQQKVPAPPLPTPRLEPYTQKTPQEQNDTSHFIGKLNTNATSDTKLSINNANQRYKIAVTEASQPSTIKSSGTSRFDRNMAESLESSRHNCVPTATVSSQAYAYNLFNDYPTSNYLPLPSLASSSSSSVTTEAAHSSLGSFSVAHNSSNFGILSWSTLSPMTAPNTQQLSGYNNTSDVNCNKQNTPTYQQMNENHPSTYPSNSNQNKSYQQSSNRSAQITYPQQTVKETQPTPRPPVNWMTTPDIRHENVTTHFDHTQVPCSIAGVSHKEMTTNNNNNNNFVSNTVYTDYSENLSHAWQGSKTNTQHQNVSNPLPTLVGDLALGPTPPTSSKYCSAYKPAAARKQDKEVSKRGDYNVSTVGSSGSFLSVSQLVDHNVKETRGGSSSRRTRPSTKAGSRRDRNKNQNAQIPVHFNEPTTAVPTTYPTVSNWPAPKSSYKATPSNYSAEALIGLPTAQQQELTPSALHGPMDKVNSMDRYPQNYPSRSHFSTESTSNYFSDQLETNYQQSSYGANCSSGNYQSSTNNYMPNTGQTFPGTDITGSSITAHAFTSEIGTSNFLFPTTTASSRSGFFPSEITPNNTGKNNSRNNKRRHTEHSEQNYQDNSYVAPNQLNQLEYSNAGRTHHNTSQQMVPRCNEVPPQNCGPTYHSARGAGVQNTTPPSNNSTVPPAGGSSLTNFNLSTIFPEINDKVPVPPLPAFVSSKNLPASTSLALGSSSGTDYMLHHSNMSFNNLLGHTPSHQVGIGLNQSFPTPSFSNMMPPSLAFSVHEH